MDYIVRLLKLKILSLFSDAYSQIYIGVGWHHEYAYYTGCRRELLTFWCLNHNFKTINLWKKFHLFFFLHIIAVKMNGEPPF